MLWNDATESLLGSEFCAFEKYENGEWVNVPLDFNGGFPAIGHDIKPGTEIVWGHTFPKEMLMPGSYRIWREAYPDGIVHYYAEFTYAGSILTITSIVVFLVIIISSPMRISYKSITIINSLLSISTLFLLRVNYGWYISHFQPRSIFNEFFIFVLGWIMLSIGIFDWIGRKHWRKRPTHQ